MVRILYVELSAEPAAAALSRPACHARAPAVRAGSFPAPPKKKGNLILFIGGGCLLILVLALATCTIATRSCATFLPRNPDYVTKRLVEMTNPDLEVVRIDRSAGIIKVYNKKEHKSLTLDLQKAKQGKISIIGDDGEKVTLGADGSGNGRIEVTDGKGKRATVETNSATGIKEAWIPKYPGCRVYRHSTRPRTAKRPETINSRRRTIRPRC